MDSILISLIVLVTFLLLSGLLFCLCKVQQVVLKETGHFSMCQKIWLICKICKKNTVPVLTDRQTQTSNLLCVTKLIFLTQIANNIHLVAIKQFFFYKPHFLAKAYGNILRKLVLFNLIYKKIVSMLEVEM